MKVLWDREGAEILGTFPQISNYELSAISAHHDAGYGRAIAG